MTETLGGDSGSETEKKPYLFLAFSDLLLKDEEGVKENIKNFIQSATTRDEYEEFSKFCAEYEVLMSPELIAALNKMKEEFLQKITREIVGEAAAT